MGAIDLVIHVEAPPGVAQRAPAHRPRRASPRRPSQGVILPKYRGDLLACAALTVRMREGEVEPLALSAEPARRARPADRGHGGGRGLVGRRPRAPGARCARRSPSCRARCSRACSTCCPAAIPRTSSPNSGRASPGTAWPACCTRARAHVRVAIANGGTIPDRGLYPVFVAGAPPGAGPGGRAGRGDGLREPRGRDVPPRRQHLAHRGDRPRPGPRVASAGRAGEDALLAWRTRAGPQRRARAGPSGSRPAAPGRIGSGRPGAAHARARSRRRGRPQPLAYLEDQQRAAGAVPDDRTILVERYRDEMGDWRVCVLCPFGARVHAPWAMAIAAMARAARPGRPRRPLDRRRDRGALPGGRGAAAPRGNATRPRRGRGAGDPAARDRGAARAAGQGGKAVALFASRFREAAARALLLPRRRPGQRVPLWQQRKRRADLLAVAARYDSFPIVLETYRECLRDVFDMPALIGLLRDVREPPHPRGAGGQRDPVALRRRADVQLRRQLPLRG